MQPQDRGIAVHPLLADGAGGGGIQIGQAQQFIGPQAVAGLPHSALAPNGGGVGAQHAAVADAAQLSVHRPLAAVPRNGTYQLAAGAGAFQTGGQPAPRFRIRVAFCDLCGQAHITGQRTRQQRLRSPAPAPGFGRVDHKGEPRELIRRERRFWPHAKVALGAAQVVRCGKGGPVLRQGHAQSLQGSRGMQQTIRAGGQPLRAEFKRDGRGLHAYILAYFTLKT
ncbi:hypothetical protein DdrC [Deinococcus geothermalis DSM 11300]|uniref:Uncharacterized protein n=1 Tax=Deinococcus geothermalis (strain DSM 11300 / CIP 105573 / AG-3a) TaxID=319795 RepID=Q1J2D4_DEIGD|nr:hypothetical protein DdrC [Deinococcus geothermalis DSM 11300]